MTDANPFTLPGHWFKGNLHVHSTASDGDRTPQAAIDWYRSRGYHFLAFTDHRVLSEAESPHDDFITLSGIEVDGVDPDSGLFHVVGLGLQGDDYRSTGDEPSLQEAVHRLRLAGGLVFLAHPYWSGQLSRDLLDIEGCFGLEVYNGGCDVDDVKGTSEVHWDDLLARGQRWCGLAVDDAHWRSGSKDAGLGWVWVKAPALTQEAILQALEEGHFYASSGPQIHYLEFDAARTHVQVRCSPSVAIDWIGSGPYSRRVLAPPGETLTEASYWPFPQQRYLRVACQDAQGRRAWSNPIFLDSTES